MLSRKGYGLAIRIYPRIRPIYRPVCAKFSTNESINEGESAKTMVLGEPIYNAKYKARIKFLRRFSFISTCASLGLLATVASGYSPSSMAIFGQYMIAGTGFFASAGGTLFVHLVCTPYVTNLRPHVYSDSGKAPKGKERSFEVTTLNLIGSEVKREFSLGQVGESVHPFASFKAGDKGHYYLFAGGLTDPDDRELTDALTKRGELM